MKHKKPKVLISGYYGFDNFGDEAVLSVLVESLKNCNIDDITVFSKNPEITKKNYNVKAYNSFNLFEIITNILHCNILFSGGGSLLQDATSSKSLIYYLGIIITALFFRKKVIIFAQGIGPIKNKFLKNLTMLVLKNCNFVTVRDEKSLNILKENKVKAELVSDPVWNIPLMTKYSHRGIGIQLRKWDNLTDEWIKIFAKYIEKYYSDKVIFIYVLQESLDREVCYKLEDELRAINPNIHTHIVINRATFEIVKAFSHLDELIAMRYHACLLGLKYGIPVVPIVYDPKVEKLANEFNIQSKIYFDDNEEKLEKEIKNLKYGEYNANYNKIAEKNLDFELFKKYL
ncbi:polysaccharide pyruvyl transferase CsaB [bacterium]|nr:polysaccharide pyruvyl transferase CsaB [bacterium]